METKKKLLGPKVNIIVAVTAKNAAIGNGGKLLVRISDDLKRFKAITKGHPVIMGRKTFESIGRPLPERTNIVITRSPSWSAEGALVAHSLPEALEKAGSIDAETALRQAQGDYKNSEIFIIGGGEIYREALPYADKLYLTIVDGDLAGDVFFPDWRKDFTKETFREERFDEKTGLKYVWTDLER